MSTSQNGASTSCPYEMWDGSYVLGSLSPAERREFEGHLDGCELCSRAVRDLAGLPGLLGRVGPEIFEESEPEPLPETLLPRLSRGVRRSQQRRTWLTAGIAAAAAIAVTSGGALLLGHPDSSNDASQPSSSATALAPPVGTLMINRSNDPMVASVALTPVAWGTKLDLTCSYPRNAAVYAGGAYRLVVHTKDGHTEQVATWNGLPGKVMHVSGATASWRKDITSVEVTHLDGSRIASLTL
jgi:anti-sigma factor RsiW